jgi:thioredoxin 1
MRSIPTYVLTAVFTLALLSAGCGPEATAVIVSADGSARVVRVTTAPADTSPLPKFLNFGADRCIPCKQMVPVREAIAAEYAGQVEVGFIDVWADREAGRAYHVRVIPTQLILDAEGRELFRHEGYWPKEQVLAQFAAVGIELRPAVNR